MTRHLITALALAAASCAAQAHVTLDQPKAPAGSLYKAVFKVSHGCEGTATHTVRVLLPDGFRGAKPMPKAGWRLAVRKAPLAQPYNSHGRQVTEDTVEVTWTAGSREAWLEDAYYDEFTVRGQLLTQAGPLWFKLRQDCEKGQWDWAEVPTSGVSTKGLKSPAVLLNVVPASHDGHPH